MSYPQEKYSIVREEVFLYANQIECDIRVVMSPIRYGSGDCEDTDSIRDDIERETYYVQYGSTTERGTFNGGGGCFDSLEQAVAAVESAPGIGSTIRWR